MNYLSLSLLFKNNCSVDECLLQALLLQDLQQNRKII